MGEIKELVTLGKRGCASFTEKKSEFIGYASPVASEAEAIDFVAEIRKKHADAKHNVYAYIVGSATRYSDDGEPQGSAGMPVLDVIRKSGVTNAAVVVTRYFGGILLGAGGLVRAYTRAAKEACEQAGIVRYEGYTQISFSCDYGLYDKIKNRLTFIKAKTDLCDFDGNVKMSVSMKDAYAEDFLAFLSEVSAGKVVGKITGSRFDHE